MFSQVLKWIKGFEIQALLCFLFFKLSWEQEHVFSFPIPRCAFSQESFLYVTFFLLFLFLILLFFLLFLFRCSRKIKFKKRWRKRKRKKVRVIVLQVLDQLNGIWDEGIKEEERARRRRQKKDELGSDWRTEVDRFYGSRVNRSYAGNRKILWALAERTVWAKINACQDL